VLLRLLHHVLSLNLALDVLLVLSLVDLRVQLAQVLLVDDLLEVFLFAVVWDLRVVMVVHVFIHLVMHVLQRVIDLELAVLAEVWQVWLLNLILGHCLVRSLLQFLAEVV
jgi:hypothetical protein